MHTAVALTVHHYTLWDGHAHSCGLYITVHYAWDGHVSTLKVGVVEFVPHPSVKRAILQCKWSHAGHMCIPAGGVDLDMCMYTTTEKSVLYWHVHNCIRTGIMCTPK